MGAFRKRVDVVENHDAGSVCINETIVPVTKSIATKDNPNPVVYVEMKKRNIQDYAEELGMPRSEDYMLRDMIASGHIPGEVPMVGMLDSHDPLDLRNAGVGDAIFDRLSQEVDKNTPKPVSEPSPVVTEPTPTPTLEPTN